MKKAYVLTLLLCISLVALNAKEGVTSKEPLADVVAKESINLNLKSAALETVFQLIENQIDNK